MKELPYRIREARLECGMSQAQLAKALGASQGSVSKWESGKEVPGIMYIVAMTTITDKRFDYFIETPKEYMPEGGVSPISLSVVGVIDAVFKENHSIPDYQKYYLTALMPWRMYPSNVDGYLIAGNRSNKFLRDNDIAFIVYPKSGELNLEAEDIVLVKRFDSEGRSELSLRRINQPEQPWLWPLTDDPEYQTPVLESGNAADPLSVAIVGLVIGTHRAEPAAWRFRL